MYEIIHTLFSNSLNTIQKLTLVVAVVLASVVFIFVVNTIHNSLKLSLARFSCKTIVDSEEIAKNGISSSFSWLSVLSVFVLQAGFAKHVVFDRDKLKRPKQNTFLISCTGIFVYIASGLFFFFFYVFLRQMKVFGVETATVPVLGAPVYVYAYQAVYSAIYYLSKMCFTSVILSFIPLIPFDMGDVLDMVLAKKASDFIKKHYPKIIAALVVIAFFTVGRPDGFLDKCSSSFMFWLYSNLT